MSGFIKSSFIDHSKDEISQSSIEQLEMQRLGLPISFGSSKRRTRRHKSKTYYRQSDTPENAESTEYHRTETMDVVVEEADDEYDKIDENGDVEEVRSIKLSTDCYDYLEMEKLKISNDDDDDDEYDPPASDSIKRDRTDDDSMTTTGSEMSKEDSFKPRRKKKKAPKPKSTFPYWKQRFILFSRFSEGIKLDNESWYSVTPEPIARHIATRVEQSLLKRAKTEGKFIILDGFCGAGGNTIQFALMPSTLLVYAVDIDPNKIELARHNATIYGCVDKIQFIVADFFEVIQSNRLPRSLVDVCFLSPPWGGPEYNRFPTYSLNQMTPNGFEIARLVARYVTKNISFLLPRNFDMEELEPLCRIVYEHNPTGAQMKVEIEQNRLYKKVKTMTAYFDDLVRSTEIDNDSNNNMEDSEDE